MKPSSPSVASTHGRRGASSAITRCATSVRAGYRSLELRRPTRAHTATSPGAHPHPSPHPSIHSLVPCIHKGRGALIEA